MIKLTEEFISLPQQQYTNGGDNSIPVCFIIVVDSRHLSATSHTVLDLKIRPAFCDSYITAKLYLNS